MKKDLQKQIWQNEHETAATLPAVAEDAPSDSVTALVDYLRKEHIKLNTVIDIGCGKGRNSIYLAQQGFTVYAVDFIEHAIHFAQDKAKRHNVADNINFRVAKVDKPWNFEDNFFDLAVDCFSSIDIDTKEGRET